MIPPREETLEQLEKVLNSRSLQGSESLRAFLRFVVVRTVDDQGAHLKEYTIATEVFGRADRYDSRSDSAVRVQAGRLRSKLEEYYSTEGKNDRVLIELPKGHYTPTFAYARDASADAQSAGQNVAVFGAAMAHEGIFGARRGADFVFDAPELGRVVRLRRQQLPVDAVCQMNSFSILAALDGGNPGAI